MTDSTGDRLLLGATVERADVARRMAALRVRVPGETWLVLLGSCAGVRVGILPLGAREQVKELLATQAREPGVRRVLEGARILAIDARGVDLVSGSRHFRLGAAPSVVRIETNATEAQTERAAANDRAIWVARGEELLRSLAPLLLQDAKDALALGLAKEKRRLERRALALHGDLARGADAEAEAARARWFVAEAARAPRGARELTATDWSSGEGRAIAFALDPAKNAKSQIDAVFARAHRMHRGMGIARARLAAAESAVTLLEAKLRAIQGAGSPSELEGLGVSTPPNAQTRVSSRASKNQEPERRPYRLFRSAHGTPILSGRNAKDNDELTFRIARPHDVWLHARGIQGSHVVLRLDKGKEPPPEALVDAAHIAAHFSGLRTESSVEVQYAARGRVRKPRGSAPGVVIVDQAKVMIVRMQPDRLARLLASEDSNGFGGGAVLPR
jgi:hypothetical protein